MEVSSSVDLRVGVGVYSQVRDDVVSRFRSRELNILNELHELDDGVHVRLYKKILEQVFLEKFVYLKNNEINIPVLIGITKVNNL